MQMDAFFKKERIGTLFVWVGALEGGFGGGGPQGCPPENVYVSSQNKKKQPPASIISKYCADTSPAYSSTSRKGNNRSC